MLGSVAASVFIILVFLTFVGWVGHLIYKSPYNFPQTLIYFVNVLATRLLWRAEVPRKLPVSPSQGVVLLSNHRSSVDPCFVQLAANRVVHWLVASEYANSVLLKRLLVFLQIIDVKRMGRDIAATKTAIRYVKQGRAVGIFPEGRINMSAEEFMMPVRPGAIVIALKGRVPIVPVYIEGSPYGGTPLSSFRMPARVVVRFGDPIDLSPYYDKDVRQSMGEIALRCAREIAKLAGKPDFEPKLAGRDWKPDEADVENLNQQAKRKMIG